MKIKREKEIGNILGTVKVITIPRNIRKQNKIKMFLKDIPFKFYSELDMTTMYTDYPFVKDLPDELFVKYDLDKTYYAGWSKGQLGCFATEKKLITDFYNTSKGNLTIFLDDAMPKRKWQNNLINAYSSLPENWDALILGTHLQGETYRCMRPFVQIKRYFKFLFCNKKYVLTRSYNKYLDHVRNEVAGLYGIIYSPNGLEKLINEPERLRKDQDDVLLSRLISAKYMNIYIAYPQVVFEGKYDGSWTQKNNFNI